MSSFDLKASDWDAKPMHVERAKIISSLIERHFSGKKFEKALEYGCGTGLLGFCLKNNFEKLYMADTSEGMLEVLKNKIANTNSFNLKPIKLDLLKDNFNEKVDVIFSLMLLHHVKDIDFLLNKWIDILKNNGFLIACDIDEEDGSYHKDKNTEHNGINRFTLIKKLEDFGLKNITAETAYVVRKKVNGILKEFPIFLIVAKK